MTYSPDPFKVAAVDGFINVNFPAPEYEVTGTCDPEREACMFRIRCRGALAHQFGVSREFLDDHAVVEIESILDSDRVLQSIKRQGPERILILTNNGVREAG